MLSSGGHLSVVWKMLSSGKQTPQRGKVSCPAMPNPVSPTWVMD